MQIGTEAISSACKLRILVVDDDALIRAQLKKYLCAAGHTVLCAESGVEALRIVVDQGPEVVITDWNMPEMDGLELCDAIRSNDCCGFIYIILITAFSDGDRITEAFSVGVDDYLAKPIEEKELLGRLSAARRTIALHTDLDKRNRELHRVNARMAVTADKLADANHKLQALANTDELTGLVNRRDAINRLEEHWAGADRHGEPLACIMLDIDHFKKFNDLHGHALGDLVLKETAEVLRKVSRTGESVCRIGGEEFLILCPKSTAEMAKIGAERIRSAVESNVIVAGGLEFTVAISAGVAERTGSMKQHEDLIKSADTALYEAKRTGRNRVCTAASVSAHGAQSDDLIGAERKPASALLTLGPATQNPKVLLVDKDKAERALCRKLLEEAGYEVCEAIGAEDALHKVEREEPNVIVIDPALPTMDGLQFAQRLKSDPSTREIPLIFASSQSDPENVVAGLNAGAEDYVTKPLRPKEFVLRVGTMARLHVGRTELLRSNEVRGEQTRILLLLLDYSRDLAAAQDLDAVLERTVRVAAELTCSRSISIMLPDDRESSLRIAKSLGLGEEVQAELSIPIEGSIAGEALTTMEPLLISTAEAAGNYSSQIDAKIHGSLPRLSTPLCASDGVVGVLNISQREGGQAFTSFEMGYVDLLANLAAPVIHDVTANQQLDQARDSIVVALAKLAEQRDNDTGLHLDRVNRYSLLLAEELRRVDEFADEIDDDFIKDLERAVPLHDIGKVAIPDQILLKKGELSADEMRIMETHTLIGAETVLAVIERAPGATFLLMAEQITLSHHEWYDGSGYPAGLKGDQIPLAARIVAVADVYDALSSKRCYKESYSHQRSATIIIHSGGTQFDPRVVEAFVRHEDEIAAIGRELADEPAEPQDDSIPADNPRKKHPIGQST